MSSKRTIAKEWKQQKKKRKQMAWLAVFLVVAILAGSFAAYGYNQYQKSYVMVFEGERISANDLRFTILTVLFNDFDDPKSEALDRLIETLTLTHRAKTEGIVLTEEEKTELQQWAVEYMSMYGMYGIDTSFITNERVAEILATETYFEKLLEIYTADVVIDEVAFNEALADYKENNKMDYYEMNVKYAFNENHDDLAFGLLEIAEGLIDFDELTAIYSVTYDEEEGVTTAALWQLGLTPEESNRIAALNVGDISEIFELENGYFLVVEVESKTIPPDAEVEENFREAFTMQRKLEAFNVLLNEWKAQANYTINQKGYDAL
jgi:hypothetical protein